MVDLFCWDYHRLFLKYEKERNLCIFYRWRAEVQELVTLNDIDDLDAELFLDGKVLLDVVSEHEG